MISECEIPEPVKLNCWKHHCEFIREQINLNEKHTAVENLKKILLQIGESQTDLYLGKITPVQISDQIIKALLKIKISNSSDYNRWLLNEGSDYKTITLSDNSVWVLRNSSDPKRYVHIHPGRYSPLTCRIKAKSLKSALASIILLGKERSLSLITDEINSIRKQVLNLPPLKSVSSLSGPGRVIILLGSK